MNTNELMEYLQKFDGETELNFLAADIRQRLLYDTKKIFCITDQGFPVFCLEVGDPELFDEEEMKAA